jgi:hypothetical protein
MEMKSCAAIDRRGYVRNGCYSSEMLVLDLKTVFYNEFMAIKQRNIQANCPYASIYLKLIILFFLK